MVIPTYNERENIASLIRGIQHVFKDNKLSGEILVVDDSSPDGTGGIVRSLAEKDKRVRLVVRKAREGVGGALQEGYQKARGDIILSMDADHSHDPKDIPLLVEMVESGHDLVLGSRYIEHGSSDKPFHKRWLSQAGSVLASLVMGLRVHDATTGFRAFRKDILTKVKPTETGIGFLLEFVLLASRHGLRITEVPIQFKDRTVGESKFNVLSESVRELGVLFKFASKRG